jgi:hypothetical protein
VSSPRPCPGRANGVVARHGANAKLSVQIPAAGDSEAPPPAAAHCIDSVRTYGNPSLRLELEARAGARTAGPGAVSDCHTEALRVRLGVGRGGPGVAAGAVRYAGWLDGHVPVEIFKQVSLASQRTGTSLSDPSYHKICSDSAVTGGHAGGTCGRGHQQFASAATAAWSLVTGVPWLVTSQ